MEREEKNSIPLPSYHKNHATHPLAMHPIGAREKRPNDAAAYGAEAQKVSLILGVGNRLISARVAVLVAYIHWGRFIPALPWPGILHTLSTWRIWRLA